MSELFQYHLRGKGHSSRGVRVAALQSHEVEDNLIAAAKLAGPDATPIEIKKTEWRNGIKLFIKAYTEPCENPLAADVKWKKASVSGFDDGGLAKFFTAKDCQILESLYRDYHEVTQKEMDDIVGKALPVSGD